MDPERQPVIVGVGRFTQRASSVAEALSPIDLATYSLKLAARDTGLPEDGVYRLLQDTVGLSTVSMFLETRWKAVFKRKPFKNFSRSIARNLNSNIPSKFCWVSFPGGNGPQYVINSFAELISTGKIPQGPIFVGGCEDNATFDNAVKSGKKQELLDNNWEDNDDSLDEPTIVNKPPSLTNFDSSRFDIFGKSMLFGAYTPLVAYPMLENAFIKHNFLELTKHSTNSIDYEEFYRTHMKEQLRLFHEFSVIAAAHSEHSWFLNSKNLPSSYLDNPIKYLDTVFESDREEERIMCYPYTKNMVARDEVDQSAFICLMSYAEAKRRGISEQKIVFIHGSGDCYDEDLICLRKNLAIVSSMQKAYDEAFRSANLCVSDIELFDIYSCFTIAVEQALACLKLSDKNIPANGITQTGGLPYHGGPGSNYSSHALCALIEKLRSSAFRDKYGVIAANGGLLTEHSVAIYSTNRPKETYSRRNIEEYALKDHSVESEGFCGEPTGEGVILTWTVEFRFDKKTNKSVPFRGVIIGETYDERKLRFIANTVSGDTMTMFWLLEKDRIGERVNIETKHEVVKQGGFQSKPVCFTMLKKKQIKL